MLEGRQIDFSALIDRSIKDFRPVTTLWPPGLRLAVWILLQVGIVGIGIALVGVGGIRQTFEPAHLTTISPLLLTAIIAAYAALRSAIPGGESTRLYLLLALATLAAVAGIVVEHTVVSPSPTAFAGWASVCALAAIPAISLLWAISLGVPLNPKRSGGLAGLASFSLALAEYELLSLNAPAAVAPSIVAGLAILASCVGVGAVSLDPVRQWSGRPVAARTTAKHPFRLDARGFMVACAVGALVLCFWSIRQSAIRVPDFDLAIEHYQSSLSGFRANVPSSSMQSVLTAYIENGMPSYMWDFGPEGFKLIGGRIEHLSGVGPVTYTWFASRKGGVMCMFRPIEGFNPPTLAHTERRHLLFYRYRGFSICLINVGGYGNFLSVIAAPLPMPEFARMVLEAVSRS